MKLIQQTALFFVLVIVWVIAVVCYCIILPAAKYVFGFGPRHLCNAGSHDWRVRRNSGFDPYLEECRFCGRVRKITL